MVNASGTSLVVCGVLEQERQLLFLTALSALTSVSLAPSLVATADLQSRECDTVAVVDLGNASRPETIRAIGALRSAGFAVIGWACGADPWQVPWRPQAVPAGAERLFDSHFLESLERLQQQVGRFLRAGAVW